MKNSLSHIDLAQYSKELAAFLVGTQLQEVRVGEEFVGLGCWSPSERIIWWIWVDLNPAAPTVILLSAPPKSLPKSKKPLNLFLNAHALRKTITSIVVEPIKGRVMDIYLSETIIELRLFPKGHNVICSSEGKRVGFCKMEDLPINQTPESQDSGISHSFDVHELAKEWLNSQIKAKPNQQGSNDKLIEKKQRALEKMTQDLVEKQDGSWSQLGEYLKIYGYQDLDSSLIDLSKIDISKLDLSKSVAYNIEYCFQKSKDNQRKIAGALARIEKIKQEIEILKVSDKTPTDKDSNPKVAAKNQLLTKAKARGRKLELGEGLEAVFGKSGVDNLALLRAANSWDLWLHLKDWPGAYAIIRRSRNQNIKNDMLQKVAHWLAEQQTKIIDGEKFDVLVTECKFVTPIKGAKPGLVTYKNAKVFVLAKGPVR